MTGLTAAEVRERVAAGRTNTVRSRTSRPVAEILRTNLEENHLKPLAAVLNGPDAPLRAARAQAGLQHASLFSPASVVREWNSLFQR